MSKWSSEYRDTRWQKKRLEIMQRDNFTCTSCGREDKSILNVHHAYYIKGAKPWEYENDMLTTLCEDCHQERHELNNLMLLRLSNLRKQEIEPMRFICGYGYKYMNNVAKIISAGKSKQLRDAIDGILEGIA